MPYPVVQTCVWGTLPVGLEEAYRDFVRRALPDYRQGWQAFHDAIGDAIVDFGFTAERDVSLSALGVNNSKAQIDLCVEESGVLVHVSGRQSARHEKELLEIVAVTAHNECYRYGVLIVRADNHLGLEGGRSSYDYCCKALLPLAAPVLEKSLLKGLLVVGYADPDEGTSPKPESSARDKPNNSRSRLEADLNRALERESTAKFEKTGKTMVTWHSEGKLKKRFWVTTNGSGHVYLPRRGQWVSDTLGKVLHHAQYTSGWEYYDWLYLREPRDVPYALGVLKAEVL